MTASSPDQADTVRPLDRVVLRCAQVLVVALPTLVALAIYLPGGLLMPSRVVILALSAVVWVGVRTPRYAAVEVRHVVLGVVTVATCLVLFGATGWLRFPEGVVPAHAAVIGFAVLLLLTSGKVGGWPTMPRIAVIGWVLSMLVTGVVGTWEMVTGGYLPGNTPAVYFKPSYPDYDLIASTFDNPNLYAYHIVVGVLSLPVLWPRRELANDGATILVSTHDLYTLPDLADEAVLLMRRVLMHGDTEEVLQPENLALAYGLNVLNRSTN